MGMGYKAALTGEGVSLLHSMSEGHGRALYSPKTLHA